MTPAQNYRFSDTLKEALAAEGLPVRAASEPIIVEDDTIIRLEGERLCMICAILVGSILLMGLIALAAFWPALGITERLMDLLYQGAV